MAPKKQPRLRLAVPDAATLAKKTKALKKLQDRALRKKSPRTGRRVLVLPDRTAKDPPKDPPLVPRPNGAGALYVGGLPGNRGGSRPSDVFKALLAEMVSHDKVLDSLWVILLNPNHEHHMAARNYATKLGYPELALASKAPPPMGTTSDEVLIGKLRTLYERAIRAVHYDEASPLQRALPAEVVPPATD